MKNSLIGILNQKEKLNLEHLINLVLDYSKSKISTELAKIEKIIKTLENK